MPREALIVQLKRHEGVRLKPYRCPAGRLTLGVGRNLDDCGITLAEAEALLANDLAALERKLQRLPWFRALDPVRQDVLINMAFNLGYEGLMAFEATLAGVRRGDYAAAARSMLASKWARQVGARARELAEQMRTGRYAA